MFIEASKEDIIFILGKKLSFQTNVSLLKEEDIDTGTSVRAQNKLEHEDDVSFSDLEDDDSDLSNRLSCNGCNDWVQLNRSPEIQCGRGQQKEEQSNIRDKDSEGEDSNDRHTVDDFE